jgi:2-oxo-4-hydroxy-4-carboxy-5-ureidoimidazoline decarboxylase
MAPVPLDAFNAMAERDAVQVLGVCCAAPAWQAAVCAGRPYPSIAALWDRAEGALAGLDPAQLRLAVQAHPRIGRPPRGSGTHESMSRTEQAGVTADTITRLDRGNRAYEARFGHVFLVDAAPLTGEEILAHLHRRLGHDSRTEWPVVAGELTKIIRRRLTEVVIP